MDIFVVVSLNIGLWRHVHPITCEWAWLICIHKYVVGPTITFYSRLFTKKSERQNITTYTSMTSRVVRTNQREGALREEIFEE